MADQQPEISIIIPTYNERDSIAAVVRDVCAVAAQRRYAIEIIIVDDNSPDGTGGEAERLAKHFPVCVVHRERKLGLGSAVVEGFSRARGRIWGLMDGDGSHPADALPDLIEPIRQGNRQIALASRYVAGGGVEYWPWHRWVLSFVATMLGRLFVPVRDPLSGFIFLDRSVIEGIPLNVTGYKIGLEILIKGRYELLVEIPYTFRNRGVGRSKLGWSEYVNYLRSLVSHTVHVVTHRAEGRAKRRAHRFATLGETGRPADATNKGAEVQAKRLWGPCPLCGADNSQFMFFKSTYRHVRCGTCGLVFVNPMPPPDELEAIYQDPRYFANRNEWTYGYNDYFEEGRFYRALFERRVSQCEEAIGAEEGSARRLLDVGCAAGFLLEVARARGWDIAGVEISTHAAGVANERLGGAVRCGTLEQARFADRSFDCVVMLDIVEHVGDPLGLLREAARALKPGGALLLSAPNVRSLSSRLAGRRWFHFKRDHVVLFSRQTLLRALESVGLECFDLRRNGKTISLNYLFARLKTYFPAAGKLLLATVGKLPLSHKLFYYSWTGEILAFCRKPALRPTWPDEVYSHMRRHFSLPTALWRTAEYFRLFDLEGHSTSGGPSWPPALDLGCGDGFFTRRALAPPLRRRLVGADRHFASLMKLKKRDAQGLPVCAEAQSLPFRSGQFGLVLANCSLEHIAAVGEALREIARVLRPDGRLVFTVPSEQFGQSLFVPTALRAVGLGPVGRLYARAINCLFGHRNILSADQWRRACEAAGLAVERVECFMPPLLAREWDRRLWKGLPGYLVKRLMGRASDSQPRLIRLPRQFGAALVGACSNGAGAIFHVAKQQRNGLSSGQ